MKKHWLFGIAFLLFLVTRVYYIKADTFSSDVNAYARYSYFLMESLGSEKNVYEQYSEYFSNKAKREKNPRAREATVSRIKIEYPPLALLWVSLPGFWVKLTSSYSTMSHFTKLYAPVYKWFMLLLDSLFFFLFMTLLYRFFPKDKMFKRTFSLLSLYYIASAGTLYIYYYFRLDLTLGFFLLLSASLLFVWKKPWASFFVLGVAINYKLVPLILIPLWALGSLSYGKTLLFYKQKNWPYLFGSFMKPFGQIVLASFLVFLPFFLFYGWETLSFLSYHSNRPVQIESNYSVFLEVMQSLGYKTSSAYTFGSINVFSSLSPWVAFAAPFFMVGVLAGVFFVMLYIYFNQLSPVSSEKTPSAYRTLAEHEPRIFMSFLNLYLMAFILSSKVLSPQYLLWAVMLLPFCFYTSRETLFRVCVGALAFGALSSYIYPHAYRDHFLNRGNGLSSFGLFLLILRNGLVLACCYLLLKEMWQGAPKKKKEFLKTWGKKPSLFLNREN